MPVARRLLPLLLAATAVATVGAVLLVSRDDGRPGISSERSPAGCSAAASRGPLPVWARTGFTGDGSGVPHVRGRRGRILAVVFGWPLSAPPAKGRGNKVLWVPRRIPQVRSPLRIAARRLGGGRVVHRLVESGPGPSYLDLPARGCWRLRLRWGDRSDTLDLPYT